MAARPCVWGGILCSNLIRYIRPRTRNPNCRDPSSTLLLLNLFPEPCWTTLNTRRTYDLTFKPWKLYIEQHNFNVPSNMPHNSSGMANIFGALSSYRPSEVYGVIHRKYPERSLHRYGVPTLWLPMEHLRCTEKRYKDRASRMEVNNTHSFPLF